MSDQGQDFAAAGPSSTQTQDEVCDETGQTVQQRIVSIAPFPLYLIFSIRVQCKKVTFCLFHCILERR